MTCPLCGSDMHTIEADTTDGQSASIEECLNCGGHFLAPALANFLSVNTTKNIDSIIPKTTSLPNKTPVCPHCEQPMSAIKDDSVPDTVTVFTCPNNHGDFYPKDQLFLFKKAQAARISYHKLWGIPLRSAFAVLIPVVIIFTAITVIPNVINMMKTSQESRVKASQILTQPLITAISPTRVLISFSTKEAAKTKIRFTQGLTNTYTVSDKPLKNHLLDLSGLQSGTTYKYVIEITLTSRTMTTSEYTFTTP